MELNESTRLGFDKSAHEKEKPIAMAVTMMVAVTAAVSTTAIPRSEQQRSPMEWLKLEQTVINSSVSKSREDRQRGIALLEMCFQANTA